MDAVCCRCMNLRPSNFEPGAMPPWLLLPLPLLGGPLGDVRIDRAAGGRPATVSFAIEVDGRSYEVSFAGCAQAAATADEVCRKFRLASRECGGVRAEFSALCALAQGEVT